MEVKEIKDDTKVEEIKISKEEYDAAVALINEAEKAKELIEKYEEDQRFIDDPLAEIMENGTVELVSGEIIRDNPMLWRATKIRYVHAKGTVERTITYSTEPTAKNLLGIAKDQIILL